VSGLHYKNVVIFWQSLQACIVTRENMITSKVAVDYSRPIKPIFAQKPQAGTIHSVFRKAVNIICDDTILALLSDELPRMPNSLRLPSVVAEELLPQLRPGVKVWIGHESLFFPTLNFSLHLPETPAWEPRPDISKQHWRRETVAHHVGLLAGYLAGQPQQEGLVPLIAPLLLEQAAPDTPLSRMALPELRLLAKASWQHDISGVEHASRGLAGLGPGLTPSGDDALAGFTAVMALLSPQLSADGTSRKHIARTIANVARPRTTALSAVLLEHAACGEVAEQLCTLLLSLALPAGASAVVLHNADCALTFGASSGGDTLSGILLGLRTLEGESD
jgi:hypothetical protein